MAALSFCKYCKARFEPLDEPTTFNAVEKFSRKMNSKALDVELREVSLEDKYTLERGQVYLTGIQALVRLAMMQSASDRQAGLNTAGFISGYRGSPLGGLDQQLVQARNLLQERNIRFLPAVNEELAATSIWGAQQAELGGRGLYDGVFGLCPMRASR